MKTPEPTIEPPRVKFPRRSETEFAESLRYVERPLDEARQSARGNLLWGAFLLILAALVTTFAALLAGAHAVLFPATAMLTVATLFIFARLHFFRQRNGGFLALGMVCFLAAIVPLLERAFDFARLRAPAAIMPVTTTPPAPAAPLVAESPLLSDALGLATPDLQSGEHVKITRPATVELDGKTYRVKPGEIFPLDGVSDSGLVVLAKDKRVTLAVDAAEILSTKKPDPAPAKPLTAAEKTTAAQKEAVRRYPALGVDGSPENDLFVSMVRELRDSDPSNEFFKDPEWPLKLVEMIAQREGWERTP